MRRPLPFHSNAVWPPALLVWLFVFSYSFVAVSLWLVGVPVQGASASASNAQQVANIENAILAVAAGVYAAFRLRRFHPMCNQAYAAWLRSTPWTAGRPLPLGPIHPVWQDGSVIGVLTVIAVWHAHTNAALPVTVFTLVYLVGTTILLAFARRWWSCLTLGFLWPAFMLPLVQGWPAIPLTAGIIAVVWHGHRRSLKTFPWDFIKNGSRTPASLLQVEIGGNQSGALGTRNCLGWPFLALSPKVQPASISHLTSVCLSALFGWWSFCAIECFKPDPLPELLALFAFFAAVFRLARYCSGVMTSFNLWGRIASGKIVVPGFDKIFLTPLLAVLVSIFGGMIVKHSGPWLPVTESCVFALIWYVLFAGGPTLRNWVLTGQHRFRPPARLNANKQLLKSV